MDDLLTGHYNRELLYIKRLAGEFADAHPAIARRLKLTADVIDDPHVGALVESFAYVAARTRLKVDDEFPELSKAVLSVLYPHYLAPIPSMSIVQINPTADATVGSTVERGTEIDTEAVADDFCRYRTCYPVRLYPLSVTSAKLGGRPLLAPANPRAGNAAAVLRLRLQCLGETPLSELNVDRLRFYLKGQPHEVYPLYELLLNGTLSVALAEGASDQSPLILPAGAIQPVGFADDEAVLPTDGRSFPAYRLLSEFFSFPEKFHFFDIDLSAAAGRLRPGPGIDVFIYLGTTSRELERSVSHENFALGCTPVVNLFRQRAEPIRLTHETTEYRVVPNSRRLSGLEIHSIDKVTASFQTGEEREFLPFYGLNHGGGTGAAYWHGSRRVAGHRDQGTEIHLTLVDQGLRPSAVDEATLSVETTCLNRDIPAMLPFGGGRPELTLVEPLGTVESLACLTPPTSTLRPPLGQDHLWRLLSHLSLNHLSISGGDLAAEAVREILRLYDFRDSAETRALIDSILSIQSSPCSVRLTEGLRSQFCRGVDVSVEFDEQRWSTSGLYLFASVLERFFGLYCALNSFTRLSIKVRGRTGVIRTWPPRTGNRQLL